MSAASWDKLYETASAQDGLFTTEQAADAGYSPQLLLHHLHAGKFLRVQRGIYRLVHYPAGEHEDLVAAWLWSQRQGVISHHTALALHDLSDLLPTTIHLTLPGAWKSRRLKVPRGVLLHFADVLQADRTWVGPVPVTSVRRTINDCALANLPPDLLIQAAQQVLERGEMSRHELGIVEDALRPFGGLLAVQTLSQSATRGSSGISRRSERRSTKSRQG